MQKFPVNAQFVSLNYFPYEGWGRYRDMILQYIEFKPTSQYKVVLSNPYKMDLRPGEKTIFLSTYEADKVPEKFLTPANNSLGLIVPANWVKTVFSNSGVTVPIFVVPEGVTKNEVYNPTSVPFTFLHFDATSYANRKGGDLVQEAFMSLFGNMQDKVRLIMKGRNHTIPLSQRYPNVQYIFQNYTKEQMDDLWKQTNCFLFPSRGEGFGLPPLEAMAHGIPTILTNGSAMQDFAELGIPLNVFGKIPSVYDGKAGPGQWDQPDILHLRDLMWDIYRNYEVHKQRAVENAEKVWDKYNFEKVAQQLASTINDIVSCDIEMNKDAMSKSEAVLEVSGGLTIKKN